MKMLLESWTPLEFGCVVCVCVIKCWARVQGDTGVLNWVSIFICRGELAHRYPLRALCFFKASLDASTPAHATQTHTRTTRTRMCTRSSSPTSPIRSIGSYFCSETEILSLTQTDEEEGRLFCWLLLCFCATACRRCLRGCHVYGSNRPRDTGRSTPIKEARASIKAKFHLRLLVCVFLR